MAKNLANLLTDIVKRAKLNTDERKTIKAALENTALSSIEIEESDYDSMLESLHNLDTARNILSPEISQRVKTETLNGVDSVILSILGEGLDEEQLNELRNEPKTPSKIRKGFDAQIKRLEAKLGKAQGEGDADLVKSLKKELADKTQAMKMADESFNQKIKDLEANHKKTMFEGKLKALLTSRTDIADDFKTSRHFAENFKADLNEFLAKNNIVVDHETEKLLNKETGTPFTTKTHDEVGLDWAISSVVKEFGYEMKSKVPEKIEIDLTKNPKDSPDFLTKSLQKINADD